MEGSQLRVAPDPALALVVRIFVGAVAERLDVPEASRDDLRLAASELFAGAVEEGTGEDVSFTMSRAGGDVALRATGVEPTDALEGGTGRWSERLELIRALFPGTEVGASVRIPVPLITTAGG